AGADDYQFRVRSGYIHTNGSIFIRALVSPAGPLQVLVRSDDVAIGQLRTYAEEGAEVTVEIPVNDYYSPSTVAAGGIAFDPVSDGAVELSTEVIGFINNWWGHSVRTVTVTP
ncbi:MAG: hypothetical protein GQ559_10260, partial [Desulfobulbaceae bacterium]|nr:hypothetical protein [Desulfobulbaceae bacterium]